MFQSPAWNVTISPAAARTRGIQVVNVSENLASVPNEPSHSSRSASPGWCVDNDEEQDRDAERDDDARYPDGQTFEQLLHRRRPPIMWPSASESVVEASTTSRMRPPKNTAMRSL